MSRYRDLLLTAVAPAVWGSTYLVVTSLLPPGIPLTVAMLRALPAGALLLVFVRELPSGIWWLRSLALGALNIAFFWAMLFVAAYRLPGGVAATLAAMQPLIVIFVSKLILGTRIRIAAVAAAVGGAFGVAMLVLTSRASLDPVGVAAAAASAVSMALGTVLSRHWRPPVSSLTFAAWQLTAGGILLLPVALVLEPHVGALTMKAIAGLAYLGLIGAAFTYFLWFRGIARLEPTAVSMLGFLSPVTAVLLGWTVLDQSLTAIQCAGIVAVLASVCLGQQRA